MRIQVGKPWQGGPFRTTCPGCGGIAREGSGGWGVDAEGKGHSHHEEVWRCSHCDGVGTILVEPVQEVQKSVA